MSLYDTGVIKVSQAISIANGMVDQLSELPLSEEHWPETYMKTDILGIGSPAYYCGWLYQDDLDKSLDEINELLSIGKQANVFTTVAQFLEKWRITRLTAIGKNGIESVMLRRSAGEEMWDARLSQKKARSQVIAIGRKVEDIRLLRYPIRGSAKFPD